MDYFGKLSTASFLIFLIVVITKTIGLAQNDAGKKAKIDLSLLLSNPIRDTQVGWFDIDNESFDNYNVRDNSFSIGIANSYAINDDAKWRLRINYSSINVNEYHDIFIRDVQEVTAVIGRQSKFSISPGFLWTLNHKRIYINVGFEIPVILHGKYRLTVDQTQLDMVNQTKSSSFSKSQIPRGFSVGTGAIVGFDYTVSNYFSLGAELSPSLLYGRLGGNTTTSTISDNNASQSGTSDRLYGITFFEFRFSILATFKL
jgi:hypothetical protein